jgi:hypothetical protein
MLPYCTSAAVCSSTALHGTAKNTFDSVRSEIFYQLVLQLFYSIYWALHSTVLSFLLKRRLLQVNENEGESSALMSI